MAFLCAGQPVRVGAVAMNWLIALGLAGGVALIAYRMRLLTWDGALGAVVVGMSIFGIGQLAGSVPLLVFFFSSSLLPRLLGRKNRGEQRTFVQVMANGGAPTLSAWLAWLLPEHAETAWMAYTASLACAMGDTWATEIGTRFGGRPRLITNLSPVPPGTSGGVTLTGTLGALFGTAILCGIGAGAFGFSAVQTLLCFIAGIVGVFADSLLGATLQGKYRCSVCGALTETPRHCQMPATRIRGQRWLDNNGVNLLSTLTAGVVPLLGYGVGIL
ncbi:MAG: DUF92 domain-containing protein [Fimbriimonadales bacterium]